MLWPITNYRPEDSTFPRCASFNTATTGKPWASIPPFAYKARLGIAATGISVLLQMLLPAYRTLPATNKTTINHSRGCLAIRVAPVPTAAMVARAIAWAVSVTPTNGRSLVSPVQESIRYDVIVVE